MSKFKQVMAEGQVSSHLKNYTKNHVNLPF